MSATRIKAMIFGPEDPWHPMFDETQSLILSGQLWEIEGEGRACAEAAAQNLIDDDLWRDYFGDDTEAVVMVEIIEPVINKGVFEVAMERVLHATATAIDDPRLKP